MNVFAKACGIICKDVKNAKEALRREARGSWNAGGPCCLQGCARLIDSQSTWQLPPGAARNNFRRAAHVFRDLEQTNKQNTLFVMYMVAQVGGSYCTMLDYRRVMVGIFTWFLTHTPESREERGASSDAIRQESWKRAPGSAGARTGSPVVIVHLYIKV